MLTTASANYVKEFFVLDKQLLVADGPFLNDCYLS